MVGDTEFAKRCLVGFASYREMVLCLKTSKRIARRIIKNAVRFDRLALLVERFLQGLDHRLRRPRRGCGRSRRSLGKCVRAGCCCKAGS